MAVLVMLISLCLCVIPLVTDPSVKYLIAIGFVVISLVVYYFIVYKRHHLPYMGKYQYDQKVL